jgi:hypothetical protein
MDPSKESTIQDLRERVEGVIDRLGPKTMSIAEAAEALGARTRPAIAPDGQRRTMTLAEAAAALGARPRG